MNNVLIPALTTHWIWKLFGSPFLSHTDRASNWLFCDAAYVCL